ncbi:MAG TPA: sugar phosphate nucleotidyltransferase [Acidimicrobiales bacterium]|nr:sugar phosphate nucleotidyltransferase [Acidimicrobiales bacterium]
MTKPVGVVLAAGLGTRLRPLTDLRPKALCPVNDVPLVDVAIERVRPWVEAVAVNVHADRAQMEAHLAARDVHLSVEDELLGTAGALGQLREWIAGRPVLLANSDAWHRFDLGALLDGWDGERPRLLVVQDERRGDFGPWRYVGSALLPWSDVARLEPVPSGLYERCWKGRDLDLCATEGPFFDCGTPADYLAANLAANGGRSVIGRGARVEGEVVRSVVWPGAVVEAGERLVDAIRADGLTVRVG